MKINNRTVILGTKGSVLSYNSLTVDVPGIKAVVQAASKKSKNVKLYIKKSGEIEANVTADAVNTENIGLLSHLITKPEVSTGAVEPKTVDTTSTTMDNEQILKFISTSSELKPEALKLSDIKWKYLVRSIVRGKNILMTGEAGTGKSFAAYSAAEGLGRTMFYFNLGATQDPRATLIGNTHFKKESGTYFSESVFVKAIQTENAVILLDEISRAHPEAWNILMTVLDEGQRYLRLDEADGSPTIKVAKGVSFIATANIGNQYTSTRIMDRAMKDRFTIIEMDPLEKDQELELILLRHPNLEYKQAENIAEIASLTRQEVKRDNSRLSSAISTRMNLEIAGLLGDGFSLQEAANVAIYPFYAEEGGLDSERTFIKQLIQKYVGEAGSEEQLFGQETQQTV